MKQKKSEEGSSYLMSRQNRGKGMAPQHFEVNWTINWYHLDFGDRRNGEDVRRHSDDHGFACKCSVSLRGSQLSQVHFGATEGAYFLTGSKTMWVVFALVQCPNIPQSTLMSASKPAWIRFSVRLLVQPGNCIGKTPLADINSIHDPQ